MAEDDFLFSGGRIHPDKGGVPLRWSGSGETGPDPARIAAVATALGRPACFVDDEGYEQEIIAACADPSGVLAYVTSSAKQTGDYVDVEFNFLVRGADFDSTSTPIKTYNPYFGCDVHFLEWIDGIAVLVYREKHKTYVATLSPGGSAAFVEVSDEWLIRDSILASWPYKVECIDRIALPSLRPLEPMTPDVAATLHLLPRKVW